MHCLHRTSLVAAAVLFQASLGAQPPTADPSGHWEGVVQAPNMEVKIEVDLARNRNGELVGTFGQPGQQIKGFPLRTVAVEGSAATLQLRIGSEGGTFQGTIGADGQSIAGEYVAMGDAYTLPFKLVRLGDPRIAPAPKSAPIDNQLEGTWSGALETERGPVRVVVKMINQSDGTAIGTAAAPDEGGVEVPIVITGRVSSLTIEIPSVGGSFVGVLSADNTELVGTWTERQATLPLTLRRATASGASGYKK
jgi:hypothetical protein